MDSKMKYMMLKRWFIGINSFLTSPVIVSNKNWNIPIQCEVVIALWNSATICYMYKKTANILDFIAWWQVYLPLHIFHTKYNFQYFSTEVVWMDDNKQFHIKKPIEQSFNLSRKADEELETFPSCPPHPTRPLCPPCPPHVNRGKSLTGR